MIVARPDLRSRAELGASTAGSASWLSTRPIAHRGLHSTEAPENTLPAFEAAARAGYPIELDVHMLPDGTVVVFHDDDLLRAAQLQRPLSQETALSIRSHRLFGTSHGIPSLSEVLELVAGRVPVLVEIKNRHDQQGVEQAVFQQLLRYHGELAVQSFNPFAVAWFGKYAPHITRGQLAGPLEEDEGLTSFQRFATRRLLSALWSRPHFINYDLRGLPDRWVQNVARMAGLPLLCWTVRTPADKSKADALGANYVFDNLRP
jgi:glycerophosphoryl diester phosphodiesterase